MYSAIHTSSYLQKAIELISPFKAQHMRKAKIFKFFQQLNFKAFFENLINLKKVNKIKAAK